MQWRKIGIDMTGFQTYIGKEIEWFQNVPLIEFPQKQYETCLNKFIKRL